MGAIVELEPLITFEGRDRLQAKQKALLYWYEHGKHLHMTVTDFFARCRISSDERRITFHEPRVAVERRGS